MPDGKQILGFETFDVDSSVAAVRARAEAYLAKRAVETAEPEPPPDPFAKLPAAPSHPSNTHVYVAECDRAAKVGFAANLYVRLSNMRTDNHLPVTLAGYYELPKDVGKDVERFVHMALADKHIRGEWFELPAADALLHVERVMALVKQLYGLA